MDFENRRILVVGMGDSGVAAARLLLRRGARVVANDVQPAAELSDAACRLEAMGAELHFGGHPREVFLGADAIVVSPGVPRLDVLREAESAGIPIISEVELAAHWLAGTIVAVTGTNGKSTVTTLIGEMCRRLGRPTFVGGNLGQPLVEVVDSEAAEENGIVVVELSSFQLERVRAFRPDVAVLLNISDDHLDRYDGFAEYAATKGRIFLNQGRGDHVVVPDGDELCASLARHGAGKLHRFGGDAGEVRFDDGCLVDQGSTLRFPVESLRIRGGYNLDNACAAALAARLVGVSADDIAAVLASFAGLPHRMQLVRELDGVRYIDDSKATNVGAAVAAIRGLGDLDGRLLLVAGGKDKGGSYAELGTTLAERRGEAFLIGEAAALIQEAIGAAGAISHRTDTMESAVVAAHRRARAGDVVLLAPACSSYDMFRDYRARGEAFHRAVLALMGDEGQVNS